MWGFLGLDVLVVGCASPGWACGSPVLREGLLGPLVGPSRLGWWAFWGRMCRWFSGGGGE